MPVTYRRLIVAAFLTNCGRFLSSAYECYFLSLLRVT